MNTNTQPPSTFPNPIPHLNHPSSPHPQPQHLPTPPQTSTQLLQNKREIKPRMLKKLLNWLQETNETVLCFELGTFQLCARIIYQYLIYVDEVVANLQLLGCTCLYLASKVCESVIVGAEDYVELACGLFTEREMMEMESKVYGVVWQCTSMKKLNEQLNNYYSLYQQLSTTISQKQNKRIQKYIRYCIKDIQILSYCPYLIFEYLLQLTGNKRYKIHIQMYGNKENQLYKNLSSRKEDNMNRNKHNDDDDSDDEGDESLEIVVKKLKQKVSIYGCWWVG